MALLDQYKDPYAILRPSGVTPQNFNPTNLASSQTFANPVPIASLGNTMNPEGIHSRPT
jgi:hypothetical protein